jgi:hypothetical protein
MPVSASITHSVGLELPPYSPPVAAATTGSTGMSVAAWVSFAVALAGGGADAASDVQLLGLPGLVRCASGVRAAADGSSRIILPLGIGEGPPRHLYGLALLLVVFVVVQLLAALLLRQTRAGARLPFSALAAKVLLPHLTISAALLCVPGLTFIAVSAVYDSSAFGAAVTVICAALCVGVAAALVVARRAVSDKIVSTLYTVDELAALRRRLPFFPAAVLALFPTAYWEPAEARAQYAVAFDAYADGRTTHVFVTIARAVLLFAIAAARAADEAGCSAQVGAIAVLTLPFALYTAVRRPHRVPMRTALAVLHALGAAVLFAVSSARAAEAQEEGAASLVFTIAFGVSAACNVVQAGIALAEMRIRHQSSPHLPTEPQAQVLVAPLLLQSAATAAQSHEENGTTERGVNDYSGGDDYCDADYADNELNTTAVAPYSYIEAALPISESAAREDADEWHPDDWDVFTSTNPQVAVDRGRANRRRRHALIDSHVVGAPTRRSRADRFIGGRNPLEARFGDASVTATRRDAHRVTRVLIRPDPFAGGSSSDEGHNLLNAVGVVALVPDESEAHAHPRTTFGRDVHDAYSRHAARIATEALPDREQQLHALRASAKRRADVEGSYRRVNNCSISQRENDRANNTVIRRSTAFADAGTAVPRIVAALDQARDDDSASVQNGRRQMSRGVYLGPVLCSSWDRERALQCSRRPVSPASSFEDDENR